MSRWVSVVALVAVLAAGCIGTRWTGRQRPDTAGATAIFTAEAITVDGKLDEAAWQRAVAVTNFRVPVTLAEPVSRTEARLLWDKDYLYVGFRALDQDVWGYLKEHDDSTCREDVLEVFIQPDAANGSYYNFEINALGTCLDGWIPMGKRGLMGRGIRWNCPGLKIATQVSGTLNDWKDKDESWQLEFAIPFAALPTLDGRSPDAGDVWKFHLARYDYSVYLPEDGTELTSCAPLSKLDYHRYEDWVPLRFAR
jgi:hypothetical protein